MFCRKLPRACPPREPRTVTSISQASITPPATAPAIRPFEKAHIIERFTRPELGRMNIEITIDDPGAYTRPWKVLESSQLAPGWELAEYVCNENNRDLQHLVGK